MPQSKGRYAKGTRLNKLFFTHDGVTNALKILRKLDLIEFHGGIHYSEIAYSRFSRIRANSMLLTRFEAVITEKTNPCEIYGPIVLRDKDKRDIDISRGIHAKNAKQFMPSLQRINDFHSRAE